MPHTYNRDAFRAGATSGSLLLNLYTSLVVIELAIKDHVLPRPSGHKVADWIGNDFGESALSVQLRNKLGAIYCTDSRGDEATVDANGYPDLRYIRHEVDYPKKSTDAQLNAALQVVHDIQVALRGKGVAV